MSSNITLSLCCLDEDNMLLLFEPGWEFCQKSLTPTTACN